MEKLTELIMPLIAAGIVAFGLIKRVNVFDCFVEGAKNGITTVISILPPLVGLVLGVDMLRCSGALEVICKALSPIGRLTGIPKEVLPLAVLSPVSGSGSLSMFESILKTYGADSFIGRTASVMAGSTETTFYAVTVYYGAVGIKKTRHTVPAAMCADLTSFIMSALCAGLS
ncbi:MAG: spore maturation protein [Clostridiales bacterium]|nr:spore maturation protein [Clostridiales bacterium]